MRTKLLCAALLTGFMLGLAGTAGADPMGVPSDYLYYELTSDAAFIKNTHPDADAQIATLALRVRFSDPAYQSSTLTGLEAAFSFDNTKLEFVGVDPVGWSGTMQPLDTTINGTLTTINMELLAGTGLVPFADFEIIANITFKPLCQSELTSNSVTFTRVAAENEITVSPGGDFSPNNYTDGTVTVEDYIAVFTIPDTVMTNAVGTNVTLQATATMNYKAYWIVHFIEFDATRLEFVQAVNDVAWTWFIANTSMMDGLGLDTLKLTGIRVGGLPFVLDDDPLYHLEFTVLCGPQPHTNWTAPLTYLLDSCILMVAGCNLDPGPVYNDGSVSLVDGATLTAHLQSGGQVSKSALSYVRWDVKMSNTFAAGTNGEPGISLNVNCNSQALYFSSAPTENTVLDWSNPVISAPYGNIYQEYTTAPGLINCVPPNETEQSLLTLKMIWDPGAYSTPSWDNRFIRPSFVNTFTGSPRATVAPDCIDCIQATSGNAMLTYGQFQDAVEVMTADFKVFGTSSSNACTYFDMKVRNNFALGSFTLDVAITTSWCINSVTGTPTGVVVSFPGNNVVRFTTNSNFVAMNPSTDYVTFGRINVGKSLTCSYKPITYTVGATLSNEHAYAVGGQEQYALKVNGASSARCIPPGNNCCYPSEPEGDPDVGVSKIDGGSGLPADFALNQNYPNPFNPVTTISLDLPKATSWQITVFNISGQVVKEYSGSNGPGTVEVEFDGSRIASGVYIYRAQAAEFVATKKMILMK